MTTKVAFIGLGVMGFPMAGHLTKCDFDVTVFNRTQSKADKWLISYNGQAKTSPAKAAKDADIIFICVGNDHDLRSVVCGSDGVLSTAKNGAIIVDHTTASADVARELAALSAAQEVAFLDAPVSGGEAGAINGQLTVMIGGDKQAFNKVKPAIDAYAKFSQLLGPTGSGQLAKMMNQICIAGVVQGLAEALHFGQNAGLDCESVIDVISKGAAQSWQMDNRSKTMLAGEYEFGFAVDWMRKDLGIALEEARRNGSTLSLTALVDQFYADVQRQGGNRYDTSSLLTRLNQP